MGTRVPLIRALHSSKMGKSLKGILCGRSQELPYGDEGHIYKFTKGDALTFVKASCKVFEPASSAQKTGCKIGTFYLNA